MGKLYRAISADGSAFAEVLDAKDIVSEIEASPKTVDPEQKINIKTLLTAHNSFIEIKVNEKEHTFTICIKNINGIDKDIITLILDFLKYVRFRTSQIIHIQDEEIKFQKEKFT